MKKILDTPLSLIKVTKTKTSATLWERVILYKIWVKNQLDYLIYLVILNTLKNYDSPSLLYRLLFI